MKRKWILCLAACIIVTSLASCNLPISNNGNTDVDVRTIVAIQVAQTQLAATMSAVPVGGSSPTAMTLPLEPSFTPTVTLTPEPSFTPTLEGVWLTVLENTNCRSGPGTFYDYVTTLNMGTQVQAIARNPDNNYYYVRNPNGSGFCWLWDQYSNLTGNITLLPVFTPQPTPTSTYTPTPEPGIKVSYKGLTSCGGQYAIRLNVKNTGAITWQSIKIVIKDHDTSDTFTHTRDSFRDYNGCSIGLEQNDLTAGEQGVVANVSPGQFGYDPTGHDLKVSVTVYSEDGLSGESYSVGINVTP